MGIEILDVVQRHPQQREKAENVTALLLGLSRVLSRLQHGVPFVGHLLDVDEIVEMLHVAKMEDLLETVPAVDGRANGDRTEVGAPHFLRAHELVHRDALDGDACLIESNTALPDLHFDPLHGLRIFMAQI